MAGPSSVSVCFANLLGDQGTHCNSLLQTSIGTLVAQWSKLPDGGQQFDDLLLTVDVRRRPCQNPAERDLWSPS